MSGKKEAVRIIIPRSDKILLTQRPHNEDDEFSDLFELPGGKIHHEEAPYNAILRETKEEIRLDVNPLFYKDIRAKNSVGPLRVVYYADENIDLVHFHPNPLEVNKEQKLFLFNEDEIKGMPIAFDDMRSIISGYFEEKKSGLVLPKNHDCQFYDLSVLAASNGFNENNHASRLVFYLCGACNETIFHNIPGNEEKAETGIYKGNLTPDEIAGLVPDLDYANAYSLAKGKHDYNLAEML